MTGKNVKSIIPDDHDEAVKVFIREPSLNGPVWNEREIWFPQEALKAIAAQTEHAPKAVDFNAQRVKAFHEYVFNQGGVPNKGTTLGKTIVEFSKELGGHTFLQDCRVYPLKKMEALEARLEEIDKLEAAMKGGKK